MITIMPCLEIMRAVTDKNITTQPSKKRVEAFEISNQLIADANFSVLVPSQLYDRVAKRLNDDQRAAFKTLYRVDNSTETAVPAYGVEQAVKLIAEAESKVRPTIILTENTSSYTPPNNGRIKIMKPEEFIAQVNVVRAWKKRGVISDLDEALVIYLFRF